MKTNKEIEDFCISFGTKPFKKGKIYFIFTVNVCPVIHKEIQCFTVAAIDAKNINKEFFYEYVPILDCIGKKRKAIALETKRKLIKQIKESEIQEQRE